MNKKSDLIQQLQGAREGIKVPVTNKQGKISKWAVVKNVAAGCVKPKKIGLPQVLMVGGGVLALTLLLKPSKKIKKQSSCDCSCGNTSGDRFGKGKLAQIITISKFLAPIVTTVFGYFRPQLEKVLSNYISKQVVDKKPDQAGE